MSTVTTIKLKIGDHYQNISLVTLFDQWKRDELQSYGLSKAQLNRVKKIFDEHKQDLIPSPPQPSQPPPLPSPSPSQSQPLSDENLDVYTDEDFDHYKPPSHSYSYYQELLEATEALHQRLRQQSFI